MKKSKSKAALAAVMIAAGFFAASSAMAAVDMYLGMSGVQGESTARPGEMDVLAWSWGASASKANNGKGNLPTSCVQDISLTKWIDSASPSLIMNSMTGAVAAQATLTVQRANSAEYLVLSMTNVTVTSFSTGGSGGEDRLTENVSLRFESMTGDYVRPTGGAPVRFTVNSGGCK